MQALDRIESITDNAIRDPGGCVEQDVKEQGGAYWAQAGRWSTCVACRRPVEDGSMILRFPNSGIEYCSSEACGGLQWRVYQEEEQEAQFRAIWIDTAAAIAA